MHVSLSGMPIGKQSWTIRTKYHRNLKEKGGRWIQGNLEGGTKISEARKLCRMIELSFLLSPRQIFIIKMPIPSDRKFGCFLISNFLFW